MEQREHPPAKPGGADGVETDPDAGLDFQEHILPLVSRTFALTIPELPERLRLAVANAYLLCRIADTIEDEAMLDTAQRRAVHDELAAVVGGRADPRVFAKRLGPVLSGRTAPAERLLIGRTDVIVRITGTLPPAQRRALRRCLSIMCHGMPGFERLNGRAGLKSLRDMDRYCYVVAGVVGEMLTELFCGHSPLIAARQDRLMQHAVAFGQALQMTNILKDFWEDRERGRCWLPREAFDGRVELETLSPGSAGFADGVERLIGITHGHLRSALEYTLLIPPAESGIRRFCLWSIGLAALTLRNIHRNPGFASGNEVKVGRPAVRTIVFLASLAARRDIALRGLFALAARGLPLERETRAYRSATSH